MNEQSPADFQSTSNIPGAEEFRRILDRLLQLLAEEVARKLVQLKTNQQPPRKEEEKVVDGQQNPKA